MTNRFIKALFIFSAVFSTEILLAQDNSPYSRYGLGDLFPQSNITQRSMGGLVAGYTDIVSVNFYNPASYASFYTLEEKNSKKLTWGRVILDVGMNIDSRKLIQPNTPNNFTSTDAFFSYFQLGVPIRKNWGMSFGIRPVSRVGYKIENTERIFDPVTNDPIDSIITQFNGSGGGYLPSIGTGYAIKNFSIGANLGYLFGNKETNTRRAFLNDTVGYYASQHSTSSSYGGVFFNAGMQYQVDLKNNKYLRLGVSGNWKQDIDASQDRKVQTFVASADGDVIQIDSIFQEDGVKGTLSFPATYRGGFIVGNDKKGWLFGADYVKTGWNDYSFFNQKDSVQDNWQLNVGGQFRPRARENYFSNVDYRFGFFVGRDYIRVKEDLPLFGASIGLGLPIINRNRLSPNQFTVLNVGLEYIKRGNNDNLLKENLFRLSLGFNFTDLWFGKRKYD